MTTPTERLVKTASSGATNGNSSQYVGREHDQGTGFYYYRARYYSPTLYRFISEDPIGFASGDTNFYAYVGNNPINKIDPFGLDDADREWEERNNPSPSSNPWYWSHNESADNPPDFSGRKPCVNTVGGSTAELMMAGAIALPARRPHPATLIIGGCIAIGIVATCAATDCGSPGGKVIPFPTPKPTPVPPPPPPKPPGPGDECRQALINCLKFAGTDPVRSAACQAQCELSARMRDSVWPNVVTCGHAKRHYDFQRIDRAWPSVERVSGGSCSGDNCQRALKSDPLSSIEK